MSLKKVTISIIIPVYNEEDIINDSLRALKVHDVDNLNEVIVVDCKGNTNNAISEKNKSWNKVQLITTKAKGRALQMNVGAKHASGDVLLFLHADTKLPRNALFKIVDLLRKTNCSAGAFDLSYDNPKLQYKITAWVASMRSRLTKTPYGDQAQFIYRKTFEEVFGFHPLPLFEDIDIFRRLKKQGHTVAIIREAISTSARRYERCWFCTITRNILITILYYVGIHPEKLARMYNKKIR